MTLATVDSAFVGEASPWRIDMRLILFQRRYANGSSLDRLSSIKYYLVKIEVAVIAQW
jgi:hypothetical protein